MQKVIINKFIVADPEICHGKPTFKGTRVMVWQILDMLKADMSEKEIIADFPHLTKNHIKAALDYASSLTKEGYAIINTRPEALA
ncbi:MAG: DUF433 domain-containing protein [Nanoarchaeota archaeon]